MSVKNPHLVISSIGGIRGIPADAFADDAQKNHVHAANVSDRELVASYVDGDKASFELLVAKYLQPVFRFTARYIGDEKDAEDITQEVFMRAWRKPETFDRSKNFKTWIFAIAKNACIDFFRKRKKEALFSGFEDANGKNLLAETIKDPLPLPSDVSAQRELGRALDAALRKLTPDYRAVLLLRYNDHFTFREIAEALGEPLDTVKSRHRRALILLRTLLPEA